MIKVTGKRLKGVFTWIDFIPTDVYAEENIYLNSDVSPITGYIQLKYTPHLREKFKDYDKTHVWKYTSMSSSQCGKTTYEFCIIAKELDTDPCNMQLAIPADKGVGDYIVKKVDPFFNGIKSLKRKFNEFKEIEKKREVTARKRVAGATWSITGTSARERRSNTVKLMLMDEVSLFPKGAVTELVGRTKSYERFFRKVILVSTIKKLKAEDIEDDNEDKIMSKDEITKAYRDSKCKKEWNLRCPSCDGLFFPTSKDFHYYTLSDYIKEHEVKDDDLDMEEYRTIAKTIEPYVECPICHHNITSEEKDKMILEEKCKYVVVSGSEEDDTYGYRENALAMFSTQYLTIAELLINADTYDEYATIYVDYFNEIYKEKNTATISKNDILLLSNGLKRWEIPKDTVKIYMAVDTQKDHFWWEIKAYQYGAISHSVAHGRAEDTSQLKDLMFMTFEGVDGKKYHIDRVGIDRRGIKERTTVVDAFVVEIMEETGALDFIYSTEGVAEIAGNLMYKVKTVKREFEGVKYDCKTMTVSNLMAKNELNNTIQRTIQKVNTEDTEDPKDYRKRLFYINEDIVTEAKSKEKSISTDYERQYTSEVYNSANGWVKRHSSVRNDYWDCGAIMTAFCEMDLVVNLSKPPEEPKDDISVYEVF